MEILKKKNDNIGLVISIVVHISILFIIFFSKGFVEIQNPPQFTLEEVITIDFSDAGGGNPGSSSPVKPEINEEANSEKEITQEESQPGSWHSSIMSFTLYRVKYFTIIIFLLFHYLVHNVL